MTQYNIYGDNLVCDGKTSYILYFSLFEETEAAQRMSTLRTDLANTYPQALFEDAEHPIFQDFKTAQEFLHGGGLPFECWRMLLCDTPVRMEKASVYKLQVLFTAFPEINIGKLTFNLQFRDTPTSEMVYLHHCNSNGAKLFFENGQAFSIKELYDLILNKMQFCGKHGQIAHLIEINRFGTIEEVPYIMQHEKKRLYGIISGDEGWNHIPYELAEERIKADWSSREFVEFITFGSNFLLLNLVDSPAAQQYRENQTGFGGTYYGGMNPYFGLNADIAGVNHGIIFSVELVMAIKTIAHRILEFQASFQKSRTGNFSDDIKRTKDYRRELIATLNRVENIDMTELGELEKVILTSQQITPIIDKIKYLLELLESELDLMYQTRTNTIANIIAVLGLVLTVGSLVLTWIGMF
ncbi:MAG: hypothetical protein IJD56_01055 [Peptococcaceae bacterium]|nr:hypothetical protein [Peptococcaceae bacterium]